MQTTADIDTVEAALAVTNEKYEGNLCWNRDPERKGKRIHFTLRVKDSKGAGHRRSFTGKRMPSACWHVHGDFFDAVWQLQSDAVIWAGELRMEGPSDNWQDRNIGSQVQPLYFSEACDCT